MTPKKSELLHMYTILLNEVVDPHLIQWPAFLPKHTREGPPTRTHTHQPPQGRLAPDHVPIKQFMVKKVWP